MPTPRPTTRSAGGPICVSVIDTVPADAATNERAALPPGVNCPLNVSVTGDVAVGEVAVAGVVAARRAEEERGQQDREGRARVSNHVSCHGWTNLTANVTGARSSPASATRRQNTPAASDTVICDTRPGATIWVVVVAHPVPAGTPMPSSSGTASGSFESDAVTLARNAVTEPAASLVNE